MYLLHRPQTHLDLIPNATQCPLIQTDGALKSPPLVIMNMKPPATRLTATFFNSDAFYGAAYSNYTDSSIKQYFSIASLSFEDSGLTVF